MTGQITSLDQALTKTKSHESIFTNIITRLSFQQHAARHETQKVDLINELHDRIGLPPIDHLREFEPLTSDPTADKRQEELQSELEAAKQEADKLRAAAQDMEKCLRLAAQHSKQRSIKLEKQKAREFAEVQSELDRVREELEVERRRSGLYRAVRSAGNLQCPLIRVQMSPKRLELCSTFDRLSTRYSVDVMTSQVALMTAIVVAVLPFSALRIHMTLHDIHRSPTNRNQWHSTLT
ncbi:hypothetical protein GN244_ATG18178 [Phytophthora infestans]|uniref:Uncharacterized protein n=1 Tax=Phytophthora infestans TaxID=4787 RepID=A0A833S996_PHYIN|nr:hypothetical protein GN244_ATG18178 [Phytophthora infestans]